MDKEFRVMMAEARNKVTILRRSKPSHGIFGDPQRLADCLEKWADDLERTIADLTSKQSVQSQFPREPDDVIDVAAILQSGEPKPSNPQREAASP